MMRYDPGKIMVINYMGKPDHLSLIAQYCC